MKKIKYFVTAWATSTSVHDVGDKNGYDDFYVASEIAKTVSMLDSYPLGVNVEAREIVETTRSCWLYKGGKQVSH